MSDTGFNLGPATNISDVLPEGYIPLGIVVSIKALDIEGDVCLFSARSEEISTWEAVGMLTSHLDDLRDRLRGMGSPEDEE